MNDTCPWHLFDNHGRNIIEDHLIVLRAISGMLSVGLSFGLFYHPYSKDNLSYRKIAYFMTFTWIRNGIPTAVAYVARIKSAHAICRKFPMWPLGYWMELCQGEPVDCGLFGFIETFMAIHEIECLTHISIERYVMAKYITNGWTMPKWHYTLFHVLCLSFAALYSGLPLVGVGDYGMDFTCVNCTMDMILPEGLMKYIVVAIFALRSIKPAGFMIFMLFWAKRLENNYIDNPANRKQKQITQEVTWLTAVYMASLTPIAVIRGWVVLSQLIYGPGVFSLPSSSYIQLALLLHAGAVANSCVVLFFMSPIIRDAVMCLQPQHFYEFFLINFFKNIYDKIRGRNRNHRE